MPNGNHRARSESEPARMSMQSQAPNDVNNFVAMMRDSLEVVKQAHTRDEITDEEMSEALAYLIKDFLSDIIKLAGEQAGIYNGMASQDSNPAFESTVTDNNQGMNMQTLPQQPSDRKKRARPDDNRDEGLSESLESASGSYTESEVTEDDNPYYGSPNKKPRTESYHNPEHRVPAMSFQKLESRQDHFQDDGLKPGLA